MSGHMPTIGGSVGTWAKDVGTHPLDPTNFFALFGATPLAEQGSGATSPAQPTTTEPTIQQTNTTAIQNELANEANATATVLTGGRGITAGPLTARVALMGR